MLSVGDHWWPRFYRPFWHACGTADYQLGNLNRPGLSRGLTCGAGYPRVTVRDRSSPGLMARMPPAGTRSLSRCQLGMCAIKIVVRLDPQAGWVPCRSY